IPTIALMDAPTGRPPSTAVTAHPYMDGVFVWLFLLLVVAYDLWSTHKVHRATIWAGVFVIIVEQLRFPISNTGAWHALATWVQTVAHSAHEGSALLNTHGVLHFATCHPDSPY